MWNNGPDLGVLFLTDKNIIALIRSVRDTKQKSDEASDVCSKPEAQKSNYLAYFAQTCVPSERSRSILHAVNASLVFMCCQAFWQNNSTSAPLHLCASSEVRILRLLSLCRFLAWSSGAPDITSAWKWRQEAKLFITVSFGHQCLSPTAQLRAYCALWNKQITPHTKHGDGHYASLILWILWNMSHVEWLKWKSMPQFIFVHSSTYTFNYRINTHHYFFTISCMHT